MDQFKEMCRNILGERQITNQGPKVNYSNKEYDYALDIVSAYRTLKNAVNKH